MPKETPQQRLKRYAKLVPDEDAIRLLLNALEHTETDLADYSVALIGQTFVERALELAILAKLAPFDEEANRQIFSYDSNGPASDFAAKIKIGYVLGLFGPQTKKDLNLIREVRNAFAHSLQAISFKTQEVAEMCKLFSLQPMVRIRIAGVSQASRSRYIEVTTILAGRLKIAIERTPLVDQITAVEMLRRGLP
ncbi:hypothetical protein V5279_37980 [Bradyrhizobium sp. 26S5]|uniref:hypothetical protein n=1 Tax=Bradyrhizobium sp. 26S5 TaxID=3139729 RepID=UPI0030CB5D8A